MISTGDMSGDDMAMKVLFWGDSWISMVAGNDVSPVTSIDRRTTEYLYDDSAPITANRLSQSLKRAIRDEIDEQNELELLRPYGLSLANYRDEGHKLGDSTYSQLVYELGQRKLDVSFLCAGFDETETAHIFCIDGRGIESNFDMSGFWAIGSGQTSALGYLFNSKFNLVQPLDTTVFHVCQAKFYAETAIGVGKKTSIEILRPKHEIQLLMSDDIAPLRKIWERKQKRAITEQEQVVVREILRSKSTKASRAKAATSPQ